MEIQLFRSAIVIAASLIVCSSIVAWAALNVRGTEQSITVTGSAKKRIKSDLVIWTAKATRRADKLVDAYKALSLDIPVVKSYLISKGIKEEEIQISSINTTALHGRENYGVESNVITGYNLSQSLEVRSKDIERISLIARTARELINKGIAIESSAPSYYCTSLGDIKIGMLAEAAKDAKVRAQAIATSTGSTVSSIQSAKMGVLQITPADSTDVSDQGISDVTSINKDITAVVNLSFALR